MTDKSQFKESFEKIIANTANVKLELPSKGMYYSKDSILSNGYVHLRYMKGEDEEILLSPKHLKDNTFIETLLQKLVLEPDFDVYELSLGDRMYLMLSARVMSLGSEFIVPTIMCPNCGHTDKEVKFDVSQIQEKIVKQTPVEPHTGIFKTTLPDCGHEITVSITTGEVEKRIEDKRKKMQQVNTEFTFNHGVAELLQSSTGIDGVNPTYGQKLKYVKELPIKDSRRLRQFMNEINGIPDNRLPHNCTSCTHEFMVPIEFGISFFFPEI